MGQQTAGVAAEGTFALHDQGSGTTKQSPRRRRADLHQQSQGPGGCFDLLPCRAVLLRNLAQEEMTHPGAEGFHLLSARSFIH
jgi:hypothetical protein